MALEQRAVVRLPRNVASKMQLLEAQAERDIAAAKAKEARANMQLAELALMEMKLYAPISGVISRPFIREGAYITKEARDQSRLATVVQLDPIQVVGQVPAAMYFQRGEVLKSIDQIAEQREFNLVLPLSAGFLSLMFTLGSEPGPFGLLFEGGIATEEGHEYILCSCVWNADWNRPRCGRSPESPCSR